MRETQRSVKVQSVGLHDKVAKSKQRGALGG